MALVLLLMLSLAAAAVLVRDLNAGIDRTERRAQRDTLRALRETRLALIAYGLVEDNTPGALPCPAPGLDGKGSFNCAGTGKSFGRLPWFQLGMMARFDGEGECLWYGVAPPFLNVGNISQRHPGNAINPAQAANLLVTAGAVVEQYVAVILAPAHPLAHQQGQRLRGSAACADGPPAAFLEGGNGDGDANYARVPASDGFNDRLDGLPRDALLRPLLRRVLEALSAPNLRAEIGQRIARAPAGSSLADLRRLDAPGFDRLLAPTAPANPSGACPYSPALARHPVAWLCFNEWYAHIHHVSDAAGWALEIALHPTLTAGYRCRLEGGNGVVSCGKGP